MIFMEADFCAVPLKVSHIHPNDFTEVTARTQSNQPKTWKPVHLPGAVLHIFPCFFVSSGNVLCVCTASQPSIIRLRLHGCVAAPQIEFSQQRRPASLRTVWPSTPAPTAWWNWIVTFCFSEHECSCLHVIICKKLSPTFSRGQKVTVFPEDSISQVTIFSANEPSSLGVHAWGACAACTYHQCSRVVICVHDLTFCSCNKLKKHACN